MEPTYEAVLAEPAREFLQAQDAAARERIWRLIRIIEIDPSIDGRVKLLATVEGNAETV